MGQVSSMVSNIISKEQECRILMIGLDGSGKTSILYKLKLGELVTSIPTVTYNIETVQAGNLSLTVWDMGSRSGVVALRHHFYKHTEGVVWVVDGNDRERLWESAEELHHTMGSEELAESAVLVLLNKHDLPQGLTKSEVVEGMRLGDLQQRWHLESTSATSGEGLYEGLTWLEHALTDKSWGWGARGSELLQEAQTSGSPGLLQRAVEWGVASVVRAIPSTAPGTQGGLNASGAGQGHMAASEATADEMPMCPPAILMALCDQDMMGEVGDEGLLELFAEGRVIRKQLTHWLMLRVVYLHLRAVKDRGQGRSSAVDAVMAIMRGVQDRNFHLTYTYFWIQLVDLALHLPPREASGEAALEQEAAPSQVTLPLPTKLPAPSAPHCAAAASFNPQVANFVDFLMEHTWLANEALIVQYYSKNLICHTPSSMEEFHLPDLKPLPSILKFNLATT